MVRGMSRGQEVPFSLLQVRGQTSLGQQVVQCLHNLACHALHARQSLRQKPPVNDNFFCNWFVHVFLVLFALRVCYQIRMKILHVAETIKGGIATALSEIIPAQIKWVGSDNVLALVPANQVEELPEQYARQVKTFDRSKRGVRGLCALAFSLYPLLIKEQPDILHLHSSFAGVVGRIVALFVKKKPVIVTCAHGWSFTMDVSETKKCCYAWIERCLAHVTDGIVNISNFEANAALRYGLPPSKMVTIYNGIRPLVEPAPVKHITPNHKKTFLFVGRLDKQKGIDLLVNAIRKISSPNFKTTVVGAAVVDNKEIIFPECVEYLGWRPRSDMTELYTQVDALIVPSRWEGFGLVAIEAMSCGTPVLASIHGALPEIVTHQETGLLFDPYDVEQFARLLNDVNVEDLAKMGQNAAMDMRRRFTAQAMTDALQAFYTALVTAKHSHKRNFS
jgi:glycosyltransferase involved in cell wall biosynthesis